MNFQFHFELFKDISTTMITIVNLLIFTFFIYWLYKKSKLKPKIWKSIVVMFIGGFAFTVNFNLFSTPVELPILPLGVWLLYWILSRKNREERWGKYRLFAWFGFLLKFIFILTSFFIHPINQFIYPIEELETFISDTKEAKIIPTVLNTENVVINNEFNDLIHNAKLKAFNGMIWYQQINDTKLKNELFPYILVGSKSKTGSNLDPVVFIEKNGKGFLVTTKEGQYYFQSKKSIFTSSKGGDLDEK